MMLEFDAVTDTIFTHECPGLYLSPKLSCDHKEYNLTSLHGGKLS